ncbi:MAG: DNA methyltransferase [Anaerolineae bacterium]|nr:DNA methyltransferase [Anaerolineae bacterium]
MKKLNPVALAEGNSKKPVYQMHKWWARRLGSVFRMLTLATFAQEDEPEVTLWHKFCNGADLQGKIVLDPFMGGGTTVVEALRLGCKVIGVDINPVAWFITKKEVEPVDLDALDAAFDALEQTVGRQIQAYYRTTCPRGHDADVMYYFWVKIAHCARCGAKVRLFPNYELSRRDHVNVCFCPACLQIIETAGYDPSTQCPDCGKVFDPRRGVSGRGVFRCPACGEHQKLLDAIACEGGALALELHALEAYCLECGRFFKRVDADDLARWELAKAEFERRKESLLFPRQAIPVEGRSDPRPVNHGYTHFWQMFNERQLLCLSMLLERILDIPVQNIRELMLLAFSDCLDANNMFCKYEIAWHKVSLFFGLHAYHPIERPAENNVWGTVFGRGTFTRCFEKVRRAKVYCQRPYERLVDLRGKRYTKWTGGERIAGYLVDSFDQLVATDQAVLLRCQSAEDLSFLPDQSVDAIITDPPYFDNVQYSELADFFYVWLRLALKDSYPWFQPELSGRPDEIVQNEKLGKTTAFFKEGLQRIFAACHRVLKDDGLLVFTFHHNQRWAWEGMAQLLLDAGFYVSATPVVRSEGKSGFHSSKGNIRYDCVLVCRKQPAPPTGWDWAALRERILEDAVRWTERTLESGMPVNEVDVFTIVMGKTVEHCTRALAGEGKLDVTLAEALREMEGLAGKVGEGYVAARGDSDWLEAKKVEQLSLFVLESVSRPGATAGLYL